MPEGRAFLILGCHALGGDIKRSAGGTLSTLTTGFAAVAAIFAEISHVIGYF